MFIMEVNRFFFAKRKQEDNIFQPELKTSLKAPLIRYTICFQRSRNPYQTHVFIITSTLCCLCCWFTSSAAWMRLLNSNSAVFLCIMQVVIVIKCLRYDSELPRNLCETLNIYTKFFKESRKKAFKHLKNILHVAWWNDKFSKSSWKLQDCC